MDFWRMAARDSRQLRVTHEVIRGKNGGVTQFWEYWRNNMLRWYGHVAPIEENRWLKRKMAWSPEGRRGRG